MGRVKAALAGTAAAFAILAGSVAAHGAAAPADPPSWAYPGNPPPAAGSPKPPPPSLAPYTVPGSTLMFSRAEQTLFNPPDWHPQDHPPMPPIVAHGRPPAVNACGYCHLPSGQGRSENTTLSGLPVGYFIQQMADFKSGARVSSLPHRAPFENMVANARTISDEEVAQAAAYFAAIRPRQNLKVIETDAAPRTVQKSWILALVPGGGREPIGNRLIETPADLERFEKRDGRVPVLVYAPRGSVARGRAIATGRSGRAEVDCAQCHGADFEGVGDIPGLKGRLPTGLLRQLHDFRTRARNGPNAAPMQAVAEHLSPEDMVSVTAYLATLK